MTYLPPMHTQDTNQGQIGLKLPPILTTIQYSSEKQRICTTDGGDSRSTIVQLRLCTRNANLKDMGRGYVYKNLHLKR